MSSTTLPTTMSSTRLTIAAPMLTTSWAIRRERGLAGVVERRA
jgi:hypothetical protein